MSLVLEVEDIKKRFGNKEVLKGISFSAKPGEIVGLLGRNGSGKSTLMKLICGLLEPNHGSIRVCGFDIKKQREKALQKIGVSIENPALYESLTGWENLKLMARWRKVGAERLQEMAHYTDLEHMLRKKVAGYSMGMKMRLMLAMVLMSSPQLIILDEPMNGLDPDGVIRLRDELLTLKKSGCTILLSSHLLSEMEKIVDRVVMIEKGVVVLQEDDATRLTGAVTYRFLIQPFEAVITNLSEMVIAGDKQEQDLGWITIAVTEEGLDRILARLHSAGASIYDIEKVSLTLEDVYRNALQ